MQEWVGYLQSIGEKERICKFVVDYVKKKNHFISTTELFCSEPLEPPTNPLCTSNSFGRSAQVAANSTSTDAMRLYVVDSGVSSSDKKLTYKASFIIELGTFCRV